MSGAEILGVTASIIAIVQISKTIISVCQFYIDEVDGASQDLRVILIELSTLKAIGKSLQYLIQPNVADSTLLDQLAAVMGPIEGCKKALEELEKLLPDTAVSTNSQSSKRRKLDAAAAALAWPLRKGKAKKLLQEIMQHKATINLALTTEFFRDLKDVKQKAERIVTFLTENELRDICKWLVTTNPSDIHNRSQNLYEPGTASWMLRTPEWPLWIEGKHRCLWIHGIPGAGKSILASYLAEEITKHCASSSSESSKLGHAYYYCYFGHNQDESSHFLRWIIGQLCRQSNKVPKELQDLYNSGISPSLSSLLSALHTAMRDFKRVYIVMDAVDESMPRADLLRVIRDLSTDDRFSALGLLVTSREYIDIEQVLEICSIPITMSNQYVEKDIGTLVRSTVQSDEKYRRWPEDLKCEMQELIPKKAQGMFRWAICQLDILRRLRPDSQTIRAALSNLPKTLDETYERIFLAIPDDDWLSVQHVFHWMVYHNLLFRGSIPLKILIQAVQQSTTNVFSHEADRMHDFEGLRERCGCLIMIEHYTDFDSGHVLFAHYTVKEYLQSPRILQKRVGFFALVPEMIQKQYAEVVFRQALAILPDALAEYQKVDGQYDFRLMDDKFKFYCGRSSFEQLHLWFKEMSSDTTLMELSEALVNPYRPGYKVFWTLASHRWEQRGSLFCETSQVHILDPKPEIFLSFLFLNRKNTTRHLALAFARRHSMLSVLTQQADINENFYELFLKRFSGRYHFVGSIPEIAAQFAYDLPKKFDLILDMIEDLGVTHFDLSRLLLLYIGCHRHRICEESCALERLLHLGASANGPKGASTTPLQIAVSCWDVEGMGMLLDAGAEPNAVGKPGLHWPLDSPMARYNYLHGASSLKIIKHFERRLRDSMSPSYLRDETLRDNIEARLLEVGAVDIVTRRHF